MMRFRGEYLRGSYSLARELSSTPNVWAPLPALPHELAGIGNRFGWGDTKDGSRMTAYVILRDIGMMASLAQMWVSDFVVRFIAPIPWNTPSWILDEQEILDWLTEQTLSEMHEPRRLEHLKRFTEGTLLHPYKEQNGHMEVTPE